MKGKARTFGRMMAYGKSPRSHDPADVVLTSMPKSVYNELYDGISFGGASSLVLQSLPARNHSEEVYARRANYVRAFMTAHPEQAARLRVRDAISDVAFTSHGDGFKVDPKIRLY